MRYCGSRRAAVSCALSRSTWRASGAALNRNAIKFTPLLLSISLILFSYTVYEYYKVL